MKRKLPSILYLFLAVIGLTARSAPAPHAAQAGARPAHSFAVNGSRFLKDGKPFQIISGEMHYVRVPRAYWRDRLRSAKTMGLNTITTYVFWNVHEPRPGVYDFTGQNDLRAYIRAAQAEGLNVILRPGPYVCAEWELGGYPAWLLKDRRPVLRSTDPAYTRAVDRWMMRLGREVKPLLIRNGGPVIAVQLENEYGAFGDDKSYLEGLEATYRRAGLADGVLLTSNQAADLAKGSLPHLPSVVNFGSGGAADAIAKLEDFRPTGPRMVGEYWAGWFDKWGEDHHETDGRKEADELRFLLERGYSVSLYMFHGGTSFGWMNGADSHNGTDYHPDTTSYDYDAPLDEGGNPRDKYRLFASVIADVTHQAAQPTPPIRPASLFAVSPVRRSASLWRNLPRPVSFRRPLTFEELGQNYGYVLYRVRLDDHAGGMLTLKGLHSYAQVYLDQKLVGTLDRRLEQESLDLPRQHRPTTLDILVENTGRINYSHAIRTEHAGLTEVPTLRGKPLKNWQMFSLPMADLSKLKMLPQTCTGPCFYETVMTVQDPADTYFDTRCLHKGQLWLGTHNLGRFWSVGPVRTLYAPGAWMKQGPNRVMIFDLRGGAGCALSTVREPIFERMTNVREKQ